MSNIKEAARKRRLPKFDSTPWLIVGIAASLVLFGLDLWALITQVSKAFIPYQVSELLGMAIALALGIHCADMISYYRKHGKLK